MSTTLPSLPTAIYIAPQYSTTARPPVHFNRSVTLAIIFTSVFTTVVLFLVAMCVFWFRPRRRRLLQQQQREFPKEQPHAYYTAVPQYTSHHSAWHSPPSTPYVQPTAPAEASGPGWTYTDCPPPHTTISASPRPRRFTINSWPLPRLTIPSPLPRLSIPSPLLSRTRISHPRSSSWEQHRQDPPLPSCHSSQYADYPFSPYETNKAWIERGKVHWARSASLLSPASAAAAAPSSPSQAVARQKGLRIMSGGSAGAASGGGGGAVMSPGRGKDERREGCVWIMVEPTVDEVGRRGSAPGMGPVVGVGVPTEGRW